MNDLYGIFKKFSYDNHYVSFTKALNSAHTTKETQQSMRQLTKDCAHGGFLVVHKGICYTTFLHNYAENNDDPFSSSLVLELASFPLERVLAEDFDIAKDMKVICFDTDKAITGHINATYAYKCNSMCLVGNDIYITLGCQVDGKRHTLFYVKYDTLTDTVTPAKEVQMRYKDALYPLNDETVNNIYIGEGYEYNHESIVETTARWSEYKGEYYTTFTLGGGPRNPGSYRKDQEF